MKYPQVPLSASMAKPVFRCSAIAAVSGICLFTLVGSRTSEATIIVDYGSNTIHADTAQNENIKVTLMPDPLQIPADTFLQVNSPQAFTNALNPATSNFANTNWGPATSQPLQINYDPNSLDGILTIDSYSAAISQPYSGGGQINVHFDLGVDSSIDPSELLWVQLVTTTAPANPPGTSPYLDVFASGYKASNGYALFLPFFYRPDETLLDNATGLETGAEGIRSNSYTIGGNNYYYDIAFDDFSQRTYQDQTIDWTGDLFLASWSGPLAKPGAAGYGATTLTIYNGIEWGWEITAVPEPPIAPLFGAVFVAFVLSRRQLVKRCGKTP